MSVYTYITTWCFHSFARTTFLNSTAAAARVQSFARALLNIKYKMECDSKVDGDDIHQQRIGNDVAAKLISIRNLTVGQPLICVNRAVCFHAASNQTETFGFFFQFHSILSCMSGAF